MEAELFLKAGEFGPVLTSTRKRPNLMFLVSSAATRLSICMLGYLPINANSEEKVAATTPRVGVVNSINTTPCHAMRSPLGRAEAVAVGKGIGIRWL